MLQGSSGSSYRLVVQFHDRNLVFAAAPFSSYKQAVRHVSAAVCRHAQDGVIARICLQRGVPLGGAASKAERVSHWVAVEQWNGDVVGRILAQTSSAVAAEPPKAAAAPASAVTLTGTPATTAPTAALAPAIPAAKDTAGTWD